jgi:hypothetical protein
MTWQLAVMQDHVWFGFCRVQVTLDANAAFSPNAAFFAWQAQAVDLLPGVAHQYATYRTVA